MSYELFIPPRRVEEYATVVPMTILEDTAKARLTHAPPKYLIKGQWTYEDGRRELDIAINRAWVDAVTNWKLNDGRLRWTCPICGKLSGIHTKACDFE